MSTVNTSSEQADERIQRRSTVRLGIRLIHKICPEINLSNNEPSQLPTVPRSLRLRLSPKARKLIKQTSLIIHGSNSSTNNSSNGNVKSIVETDVVDGLNRVSAEGNRRDELRKEASSVFDWKSFSSVSFVCFSLSKSLQGPQGSVDKPFLWTEGRVNLKASLNKSAYTHGENVNVTIDVKNDSRKVVRKIRVSLIFLKGSSPFVRRFPF